MNIVLKKACIKFPLCKLKKINIGCQEADANKSMILFKGGIFAIRQIIDKNINRLGVFSTPKLFSITLLT